MKFNDIIDSRNVSYKLGPKIGEGAQGYVYSLENDEYIVKLFKDGIDDSFAKLRIRFLIQLGLDKDVFAVPERTVVSPRVGYIARCTQGMVSLDYLKRPNTEDKMDWFIKTGGLAKRYQVLLKLANALRTLHGKGLMYMDLSMKNIYVSSNPQKAGLTLIDLDNVCYKSSINDRIFTPFYGAPEVVNGFEPNSTQSDCFSFAVIAYELFTWSHPLIGDYVSEGEPELEEQALRGFLPWVECSSDNRNKRTNGLPTNLFVDKSIQTLFKRTFEDGLNIPEKRPTMSEWYDVLKSGLDKLIKCDTYNMFYPYENFTTCPICGNLPSKIIFVQIKRWDVDKIYDSNTNTFVSKVSLSNRVYQKIALNKASKKRLYAYHLLISSESLDRDTLIAELEIIDYNNSGMPGIRITTFNNFVCKLRAVNSPNHSVTLTRDNPFLMDKNKNDIMLCFNDDITKSQRVLTFIYAND